ncbi:MAG: hypothetical protein NTW42_10500 [Deltaproteobacteria bacterium]|nr:hypothetical protein [Deltaproteobacteria bacterium]
MAENPIGQKGRACCNLSSIMFRRPQQRQELMFFTMDYMMNLLYDGFVIKKMNGVETRKDNCSSRRTVDRYLMNKKIRHMTQIISHVTALWYA